MKCKKCLNQLFQVPLAVTEIHSRMAEKLFLKWKDFDSKISSSFEVLRREKDFFDVTLVGEDEFQIEAHKVVLSACSPFFKNILKKNAHQHPLIYLNGLKSKDLKNILDYFYNGKVQMQEGDLNDFLSMAYKLKVSGISQPQENANVQSASPPAIRVLNPESLNNKQPQKPPAENSAQPQQKPPSPPPWVGPLPQPSPQPPAAPAQVQIPTLANGMTLAAALGKLQSQTVTVKTENRAGGQDTQQRQVVLQQRPAPAATLQEETDPLAIEDGQEPTPSSDTTMEEENIDVAEPGLQQIMNEDPFAIVITEEEENIEDVQAPAKFSATSSYPLISQEYIDNKLRGRQQLNPPVDQFYAAPEASGFKAEFHVSKQMAAIIGTKEGELISRPQVTKRLWAYLMSHNLRDPHNKQYFYPDTIMAPVFGTEKIRCFAMTKYITPHLRSPLGLSETLAYSGYQMSLNRT